MHNTWSELSSCQTARCLAATHLVQLRQTTDGSVSQLRINRQKNQSESNVWVWGERVQRAEVNTLLRYLGPFPFSYRHSIVSFRDRKQAPPPCSHPFNKTGCDDSRTVDLRQHFASRLPFSDVSWWKQRANDIFLNGAICGIKPELEWKWVASVIHINSLWFLIFLFQVQAVNQSSEGVRVFFF